jgi:hypothetical protein
MLAGQLEKHDPCGCPDGIFSGRPSGRAHNIVTMKCQSKGGSHKASRECSEYTRRFCNSHIEKRDLCQSYVCFECRDARASNPLHDEGERST